MHGGAALVTRRLERARTINDKQVDDDWRFVNVYARQDGRWGVVLFQAFESAQP
jgi:hypothetical protein